MNITKITALLLILYYQLGY